MALGDLSLVFMGANKNNKKFFRGRIRINLNLALVRKDAFEVGEVYWPKNHRIVMKTSRKFIRVFMKLAQMWCEYDCRRFPASRLLKKKQ